MQRPQFSKSFVGWLEPGHNHDDGDDDDDDDDDDDVDDDDDDDDDELSEKLLGKLVVGISTRQIFPRTWKDDKMYVIFINPRS